MAQQSDSSTPSSSSENGWKCRALAPFPTKCKNDSRPFDSLWFRRQSKIHDAEVELCSGPPALHISGMKPISACEPTSRSTGSKWPCLPLKSKASPPWSGEVWLQVVSVRMLQVVLFTSPHMLAVSFWNHCHIVWFASHTKDIITVPRQLVCVELTALAVMHSNQGDGGSVKLRRPSCVFFCQGVVFGSIAPGHKQKLNDWEELEVMPTLQWTGVPPDCKLLIRPCRMLMDRFLLISLYDLSCFSYPR